MKEDAKLVANRDRRYAHQGGFRVMASMRTLALIFLSFLLCLAGSQAQAGKRVALVIGNSTYKHVPDLPNPINDAAAVHLLLKSAGFDEVESRQNLGIDDMRRAVRDFSERTRDAEIAVIYYAGHGMEV